MSNIQKTQDYENLQKIRIGEGSFGGYMDELLEHNFDEDLNRLVIYSFL